MALELHVVKVLIQNNIRQNVLWKVEERQTNFQSSREGRQTKAESM